MFRRHLGAQHRDGPRRKIRFKIDERLLPVIYGGGRCGGTGAGKMPGPLYTGKALAIGYDCGWRGLAAVTAFAVRIGVLPGVIPVLDLLPIPIWVGDAHRRHP